MDDYDLTNWQHPSKDEKPGLMPMQASREVDDTFTFDRNTYAPMRNQALDQASDQNWQAIRDGLSAGGRLSEANQTYTDAKGDTWHAQWQGFDENKETGQGGDWQISGIAKDRTPGKFGAGAVQELYDTTGQHMGAGVVPKRESIGEAMAPVLSVMAAPITAMVAPGLSSWIGSATGLSAPVADFAAKTAVRAGLSGLSGGDVGDALIGSALGAGVNALSPDVTSALSDHLGIDPKNAALMTKIVTQYAPQLLKGGVSPQAALGLIQKLIPANAGKG